MYIIQVTHKVGSCQFVAYLSSVTNGSFLHRALTSDLLWVLPTYSSGTLQTTAGLRVVIDRFIPSLLRQIATYIFRSFHHKESANHRLPCLVLCVVVLKAISYQGLMFECLP